MAFRAQFLFQINVSERESKLLLNLNKILHLTNSLNLFSGLLNLQYEDWSPSMIAMSFGKFRSRFLRVWKLLTYYSWLLKIA